MERPTREKSLEDMLRSIEFPGEDPDALDAYLRTRGFAEAVMRRIDAKQGGVRKAAAWAGFAAADIGVLGVLGSSDALRTILFGLQQALERFFFLFLGLAAIGGIFGFLLTIDTSRFSRWARRYF